MRYLVPLVHCLSSSGRKHTDLWCKPFVKGMLIRASLGKDSTNGLSCFCLFTWRFIAGKPVDGPHLQSRAKGLTVVESFWPEWHCATHRTRIDNREDVLVCPGGHIPYKWDSTVCSQF